MTIRERSVFWLLIPLLLLVMALGARGLDFDTIWGDEYHSIYDAGGVVFGPLTPAQIWERVATRNPWHTPGFFILLSGWGGLVGWSAAALRAFSLFMGLLGVAWVYRLGRDLLSPRAGLLSALVLALSASYIYYLHEIRMYMVFVPLTAFTLWVYVRIVRMRREPGPGWWAGLVAGAVGMLYIHYFAALPLFGLVLFHALRALALRDGKIRLRLTPRWWRITGVLALSGALFLPWVSVLVDVMGRVTKADNLRAGTLDAPQTVSAVVQMFANASPLLWLLPAAFALVRPRRGTRWLLAFTVVVFGLALLVNIFLQVIYYDARARYLFSLWPLLALVAGAGLDRLAGLRAGRLRLGAWGAALLVGGWAVSGLWNSIDESRMRHYLEGSDLSYPMQHVAEAVSVTAYPGDVVVNYLPDAMPAWRYGGIADYYFWPLGLDFRVIDRQPTSAEQTERHVQVLTTLENHPRVWLAHPASETPAGLVEFTRLFTENYTLCGTQPASDPAISVALYTRSPVCCVPPGQPAPTLISYGNGVALSGAEVPSEVTDTLPVTVAWAVAEGVPPETYSVGLHVLDSAGNLVAQQDEGLVHQAFSCARRQLDVSGLSPGDYRLAVVVYAWATGERLTGTFTLTGERGDVLTLGEFRVR